MIVIMDSKTIAGITVFAAVTVALNLSPVKVPAPYAPFLIYQVWEVPIVVALLLYGLRAGVVISVINTLVLLAVFPGALPTGPLYNLVAVLSTLLGVYGAKRVWDHQFSKGSRAIMVASSTTLGIIMRVAVMTIVNWIFLPYPPPIGFSMPAEAVVTMLPVVGFFNVTLALYTVPIGYLLARISYQNIREIMQNESRKTIN